MEESHFSSRENFSYFSCEKERKRVTFPVERKNIATFPELKKSLFQWKERTGPLFLTSYVYQQNGSSIIFLTPGKVRGLQLFFFLLSAKRGPLPPAIEVSLLPPKEGHFSWQKRCHFSRQKRCHFSRQKRATSPAKRGPLLLAKEGHFFRQKRVTSPSKIGLLLPSKRGPSRICRATSSKQKRATSSSKRGPLLSAKEGHVS